MGGSEQQINMTLPTLENYREKLVEITERSNSGFERLQKELAGLVKIAKERAEEGDEKDREKIADIRKKIKDL